METGPSVSTRARHAFKPPKNVTQQPQDSKSDLEVIKVWYKSSVDLYVFSIKFNTQMCHM